MSDLLSVDQKVREADEWRGTTEVSFGEEDDDGDPISYALTYRQLYENQFAEAVDRIGADNFESKVESLSGVTESLSQEQLETYRELSSKDPESLNDDDREQLQSIADNMEDSGSVSGILELMDPDMIDGLQYAAKKGVVPDEDDVEEVLNMTVPEQKERFGDVLQTEDKAREALNTMVQNIVDRSTGFTAYELGLNIIMESMGGKN